MTTDAEQPQHCPVFEKDGDRFIVLHPDFVGTDDEHARQIGWGASLVECVLWGAKFTRQTVDVTHGIPHREAHLQGTAVACIGGPLFCEAMTNG